MWIMHTGLEYLVNLLLATHVPVLCSTDRIMYQPEFCAVWLDRLTSKSNSHGLLFSVQFRVWAGVCSDAPAFSAAACKRLSLVHKAIR